MSLIEHPLTVSWKPIHHHSPFNTNIFTSLLYPLSLPKITEYHFTPLGFRDPQLWSEDQGYCYAKLTLLGLGSALQAQTGDEGLTVPMAMLALL